MKHRNRIHHLAPLSKIYEKYLCVSHFRLSDRIEIGNFLEYSINIEARIWRKKNNTKKIMNNYISLSSWWKTPIKVNSFTTNLRKPGITANISTQSWLNRCNWEQRMKAEPWKTKLNEIYSLCYNFFQFKIYVFSQNLRRKTL